MQPLSFFNHLGPKIAGQLFSFWCFTSVLPPPMDVVPKPQRDAPRSPSATVSTNSFQPHPLVPSLNQVAGEHPRRSKRRKHSHQALNLPESHSLVINNAPQAPELAKCKDRRVRGRRGHLKMMTEMPLDVLFEIFGCLEPIDLLNLSWANKSLNDLIMGKAGRFLWEDVNGSRF